MNSFIILDGSMVRLLFHANKILFLILIGFSNSNGQSIVKPYSHMNGIMRDVIVVDSNIFTIHFIPDTSSLNTAGEIVIYKFDYNLNKVDSVVLDSLIKGSIEVYNNKIYIGACRVYPDTFTRSMHLYKLNLDLSILTHREIKDIDVATIPTDLTVQNDSLLMFVAEDRYLGMGNTYFKEYIIDTTFSSIDSISCGVLNTNYYQYLYQNTVFHNQKKIHSGYFDISNQQPHYFTFENGSCNNIVPFSTWHSYIFSNANHEIVGGNLNYLLHVNNSFYVPFGGEQSFGNFNSVSGLIKTDTLFNLDNYYISNPSTSQTEQTPFRNKSIDYSDGKIILASHTKTEALFTSIPSELNEIRIDIVDTSMNFISSTNIDPLPSLNRSYYGSIVHWLSDGSILLAGSLGSIDGNPSLMSFILKYNNLSDLLSIGSSKNNLLEINLYPNPAINEIFIEPSISFISPTFSIYNVNGKLIKNQKLDINSKINITNLEQGIYFLEVESESKIYRGKFIRL